MVGREMNNEPVAWLMVNRDDGNRFIQMGKPTRDDKVEHEPHPLYTHPAKTLTDEEIWDFINALCLDMGDYWELTEKNAIPMIRAILKKASEK
jgi:hypothetical protein